MVSLPKARDPSFRLLVICLENGGEIQANWITWTTSLAEKGWTIQKRILSGVSFDTIQVDNPTVIALLDDSSQQKEWTTGFCTKLRAKPYFACIPIVIVSDISTPDVAAAAFQAGASDYLLIETPLEVAIARLQHHAALSQHVSSLIEENRRLKVRVEKAREVEESLRGQAAQEKILTELTQRIRQSLELSTILDSTVREVRQLLNTDRVLIYRFNSDWSGEIAIESVSTEELSILGEVIHDPCFENHWNRRYLQGRVCAIDDVQGLQLDPCYLDLMQSLKVRANLVLPILQRNRLWGLLVTHHCQDARTWHAWEIELLKKLAVQLAIAIQQSELYYHLRSANQELERQANLDSLTQLANRRQFDHYITQEWRRSQREQQPMSLLLCDIDHFKQYNDTYGHQAGDECLRQVAQALARVIKRPADLVARYGGEEFSVILPNTNLEGAIEIAEQVQAEIAQLHIQNQDTYLTISIGIACMIPPMRSASDRLITLADQALYQAKADGRDRYCIQDQRS